MSSIIVKLEDIGGKLTSKLQTKEHAHFHMLYVSNFPTSASCNSRNVLLKEANRLHDGRRVGHQVLVDSVTVPISVFLYLI